MKCINCDKEIQQNQVVAFMFGDNLETYPVCKSCMDRLTQAAQAEVVYCDTDSVYFIDSPRCRQIIENWNAAIIENSMENYTPGIIEEEL